jgi:hypothetical protein
VKQAVLIMVIRSLYLLPRSSASEQRKLTPALRGVVAEIATAGVLRCACAAGCARGCAVQADPCHPSVGSSCGEAAVGHMEAT